MSPALRHPNVFSNHPGAPFLDTLVKALLDGRLVGRLDPADPFALADLTLYLPTRRAARAIRERFLVRLGRPVLLPRIRTLGDIDEDEIGPEDFDRPELPAAISATERQLVLTKLVLQWSGALVRAAADFPDEEPLIPASPADAAQLAAALGRLIDQVGSDPAAWTGLFSGIDADLARYWEITLEFLKIATARWPEHLAERGLLDPGARRDALIRGEAERLRTHGSRHPVIAAGSTGSVPATAELLAAIAALPNGAVVLPGLDRELDDASWNEIGPSEREPAGAGHPQHGLKQLLKALRCRRDAVEELGAPPPALLARQKIASEAMRPAGTTDRWTLDPAPAAALALGTENIGVVEAPNEREEALAAATILREAAEQPGKVAALVTPDRGLARRVAVELTRWGIRVDDSGGRPLPKTPPGVFARLVAEAALDGCQAQTLLALLKHPLASFGLERREARSAARALERAILRGPRLKPGLAALRKTLAHHTAMRTNPDGERTRLANAVRNLFPSDLAAAAALAEKVESALAPLERCTETGRTVPLTTLVEAHLAAAQAAASDPAGDPKDLFADEAGETLANMFDELRAKAESGPSIRPVDYPALFSTLIDRSLVRRRGGLDARVHIWGALEARLQSVDVVVLGGLNEGTWPSQTRLDPLLTRPMRAALALEPPERRIGLSAHDFAQALGQPTVWLTRSLRQDNEPRVASRWLQRLTAYAGEDYSKLMRARGAEKLELARRLDEARSFDRPVRPCPVPPAELRPTRLSVTYIEKLIRDPYEIYASRILDLQAFEALGTLPDASDRGTLIHKILEAFVRERPRGPFDKAAESRLIEIGRVHFDAYADFPEIGQLWWPRFRRIARWFIAHEAGRDDIAERMIERTGSFFPLPGFQLTARADRVDRLTDGRVGIVDYKTGTPPGAEQVLTLAPQLPLEALIAQKGGFPELGPAEVARLEYYHISGRGEGGKIVPRGQRDKPNGGKPVQSLAETIRRTEERLGELIAYFQSPGAQYMSQKIPNPGRFTGDYDHLARVDEWALAAEADDQ